MPISVDYSVIFRYMYICHDLVRIISLPFISDISHFFVLVAFEILFSNCLEVHSNLVLAAGILPCCGDLELLLFTLSICCRPSLCPSWLLLLIVFILPSSSRSSFLNTENINIHPAAAAAGKGACKLA